MRVPYFSLLALFGLYLVAAAPGHGDAPSTARVVASRVPDSTLTPGAVLSADIAKICAHGYAKSVRHTATALKRSIYAEYHVAPGKGRYEIDHLIPLELGGADARENLWPQPSAAAGGNAGEKDRLESYLHREVCAGRLPLTLAQMAIAKDWLAAYRKYLGEP